MSDRGSLENLKQEIVENIYTNENQAVTGDLLQDVLIDAVDTMGVSVSQNTLSIGGNYAGEVSTTYDVTLHNNGATFASLEALLSDANLNTLIPLAVRKGGMSIKFVQTSDNKYVQFRCNADDFTTDVDKWTVVGNGEYIKNPEFVVVFLDKNKNILFGVQKDNNFLFGGGVPKQVKDYVEEKVKSLSDIEDFIGELINDNTLSELLDDKVDKEEGKSLIDEGYAQGVQYIENPEFAFVALDDEKNILFAVRKDNDFLFGCGVPNQIKDYVNTEINGIIAIINSIKRENPFNGEHISDLALVNGAVRNPDGSITVSGGKANRAWGSYVMCWYYSISAKFVCTSGVSMMIGKCYGNGIYFEFYKDNNGSYLRMCNYADDDVEETKTLGFELNEDEQYTIIVTHQPTVTKVELFGEFNEYYSAEFDIFNMFGKAFVASNATANILSFYFGLNTQYDIRNIKLAIWGHSFVEANGHLGDDYMQSFSGLLASALGEDVTVNFGRNGDGMDNLYTRMQDEVNYVDMAQYGMICIGANDTTITLADARTKYITMCNFLMSKQLIPILFTIAPGSNGNYGNTNFPSINTWIRSSGYLYVDMDKVFWDKNGNVRSNLFIDGGHPNVEGHAEIFKRIKMDCSFLF